MDGPRHIYIDLLHGGVPSGTIVVAGSPPAEFEGWLSFLSALERAMGIVDDGALSGQEDARA